MIDVAVESDHVARTYDDAYFTHGGGGYPDYAREAALLRRRGAHYAKILSRYRKPARLLDVGCAAGFVTAGFAQAGWDVTGLEPNASMAESARKLAGIPVCCTTLERFAEQSGERFDVVAMIQIVGHLIDPERAFRSAARLTAPGGLWLIETWDVSSWSARVLGRSWHEYNPPSVLQIFSHASLARFAAREGLREVTHGRPHKSLTGAHAKALLGDKSHEGRVVAFAATMARLVPDTMTLPYPADDVFYTLFQKPA